MITFGYHLLYVINLHSFTFNVWSPENLQNKFLFIYLLKCNKIADWKLIDYTFFFPINDF